MHRSPHVSIATALAIAFTGLSAWVLHGPADASHSFPDGSVYRYQAQTLAAGHLFAAAPPDPLAFRFPMTRAADDKWLSPYYPGFALFLAPAIPLHLEWLVNPMLGGLLVFGTFLLGRRLYGSDTGLLAAAILALSPFHLSIASTFLSHVACAVLLLAAALLLDTGRPRAAAAAGFLFGWAVATRPFTAVCLLLPLAVIALIRLRHDVRAGLRLAAAATAGTLPWAGAILAWNHATTGGLFTTPYSHWWPGIRLGFIPIQHRGILPGTLVERYSPYIAWLSMRRLVLLLGRAFWAMPFTAGVLLLPAAVCARGLGAKALLLLLAPLALIGGYFFYPGTLGASAISLGPRFYYEALPALAVLAAYPLARLARSFRWGRAAAGVVLLGLFVIPAAVSLPAKIESVRLRHEDPGHSGNRELERFLRTLDGDERRLVFVDISTYDRPSAMLLNRSDLGGPNVLAIYWDPPRNRELLDAFPGRNAYLLRRDATTGAFSLAAYDPDRDEEGPPSTYQYQRLRKHADD